MKRGILLLLSTIAAAGPGDGAEGFAKGLDGVRALIQRRRWEEARKRLDLLLEEHARAPYVFAGRGVVEELMRTLVFELTVVPPDAKDVVSGRIVAHNARTGTIRIVYTRDTMGDWARDGDSMLHPATFDGPHSIALRGDRYPKEEGGFVNVCLREPARIMVGFGLAERRETFLVVPGIHATLRQSVQNVWLEDMAPGTPSPLVGEKPFEIRVDVDATAVTSTVAGKRLQRGKKDAGRWGSLSFTCLDPDEVEIEGKIDPAWIEGLMARARKAQLDAFEQAWRPEQHLPPWLAGTRPAPAGETSDGRAWPVPLDDGARAAVGRVATLARAGNATEALRILDASQVPEPSRGFQRAILLARLGRWDESALAGRKVREADPSFVPAVAVEAEALAALGKGDAGVVLYREVLARFPGDAELHAEAALFLGTLGRWEEAERVIGEAASRGLSSKGLARAGLVAHRTLHGPAWPKRHTYESRHYDVESDIDRKICFEAAELLEKAYAMFLNRLERTPPAEGVRFRVFLFSDEAGYQAHVEDMLGMPAHGTAGLYAPALQQLLIWNPRDRDAMMRTIRHEGFHQYLHRIMPDPPRWFDEGLAEYFEAARVVRGEWSLGEPRREHLDLLSKRRKPLDEFLFLDAAGFWKEADLHYAEAWAFVHFLLHHTPWNRQLFDRFWETFKRIPSHGDAIRETLADCPLRILDADFDAYLRRMRDALR